MERRISKFGATGASVAAVLSAAAILAGHPMPAQAGFYDGKTVKIIVGLRAGGTADRTARLFSTAWEKQLGGGVKFVVQNMPGGGSSKAMNFVYEKAKPDGLTMLFGPWIPVGQAMGQKALRAKQERFVFVGGAVDTRVDYIRTDIVPGGFKKLSDIMKVTPATFKVGGNQAAGISDLMARFPQEILGTHYGYVTGFRGGSGIFAAMKRNEVQLHNTSFFSFRTRSADPVKKGEMMGLWYHAYVDGSGKVHKNPYVTDTPTFYDAYKEIKGSPPSGPKWEAFNWLVGLVGRLTYVGFLPPGSPAAAAKELGAAFEKACNSDEVRNQIIKRAGLPFGCISVAEGKEIINSLPTVKPSIVKTLEEVVKHRPQ